MPVGRREGKDGDAAGRQERDRLVQMRKGGSYADCLPDDSALFKNNYSMLAFVFGAGFAFEIGFNSAADKYWNHLNKGVSDRFPALSSFISLCFEALAMGQSGCVITRDAIFTTQSLTDEGIAPMEGHPREICRGRR
ncbi:hypothetical protein SODALDRAFT_332210 [Sodiomyces alkalinus F11]|uniref:Complex III subunit 9 n=1 Tax=Sodiomyces alkalinus (strain CBS 110278 / VKM F-3762 / F11) TaxID=1314773 RepID=A0A3N2PZU4_SODAK|nr:hypothetical protein SODALDRAFT_332210 [Sodiomyces alkalinus F11]ROT40051.1 hypothetical protein SODALDRAFT_332210 [Sodiomyces alkalinus F11]